MMLPEVERQRSESGWGSDPCSGPKIPADASLTTEIGLVAAGTLLVDFTSRVALAERRDSRVDRGGIRTGRHVWLW